MTQLSEKIEEAIDRVQLSALSGRMTNASDVIDTANILREALALSLTTKSSLADMMSEVVAFERSKGWQPNDNQFGTSLALLHSEISEALEAYREGDWGSCVEETGWKPNGVSSELADVLIRLLSTWAQFLAPLGFDLEDEYEMKMAYNRKRSYRHGGKTV